MYFQLLIVPKSLLKKSDSRAEMRRLDSLRQLEPISFKLQQFPGENHQACLTVFAASSQDNAIPIIGERGHHSVNKSEMLL